MAILAADVVGYSRLMEADETGTLATMKAHRAELWGPMTERHGGRVVGTAGDSLLVEFGSAVAAVECAVAVQRGIIERNSDLPEERRMQLRIGVNIGEVIVDDDDIYGDGVNVAARLESLADPGGICVSDDLYRQVVGKTDFGFEDAGEHEVKNIARPVQVWRWAGAASTDLKVTGSEPLPLPDKPSIAVLPFENMSGDPEQEYFSDGLTEDIITALSHWRSFPVIARNSTFVYKGKRVDVKQAAHELGARYVLEGSVRRGGRRLRISAQLIDATTGHHVWAEKFDRDLDDIFELQDEIVQRITATVAPELERAEQRRSVATKPQNLEVWEYCQRGMSFLYEFTKEGNERAREMFDRAVARDPNYSQAYSGLAYSHHRDRLQQNTDDREISIAKCLDAAKRAVTLDPADSNAHSMLALAHVWPDQHELAISEAERALELNPNDAQAHTVLGTLLDSTGNSEDGIRKIEKGLQLNPQDPGNNVILTLLARAHLNARRYEDAVGSARKALHHLPGYPNANYILAASLGHLDRQAEARAALDECERVQPGFAAKRREWKPYSNPADNEHILDGLRKAGFSD